MYSPILKGLLGTNKPLIKLFVIVCIIAVAILIRAIHLDADTPDNLSSSAGLYVDEGYKTLTARNMSLFGEQKWHPDDTYPGWRGSSLTQWPYFAAFKLLGTEITSARLVTITYYAVLLLAYALFMHRKYNTGIFYLGLIMLCTESTLYFFSRVALFEVPMITFIYGMILALSLNKKHGSIPAYQIVLLVIGTAILSEYLKPSAIIYMAPVLSAITMLLIFKQKLISDRKTLLVVIFLALLLFTTMFLTYDIWGERINFSPYWYVYYLIENPLLKISPFLVMAGLACAAYAIAYQPNHYFLNTYRLSLLSLVVLGSLILPLFSYHPVRYYVPFLPAYIFLIVEWFQTAKEGSSHEEPAKRIRSLASISILFLLVMYGMIALELHEQVQVRILILIGAVITACAWFINKRLATNLQVKVIISLLVLCSIVQNIYTVGYFLNNPSYKAEEMRMRLTDIVKKVEIVSGGWAPFLTLGTPIKVLYANDMYNQPDTLKIIKPDYFILSETPIALKTFDTLKNDEAITIAPPINLGIYNETNVFIYPLSYKDLAD